MRIIEIITNTLSESTNTVTAYKVVRVLNGQLVSAANEKIVIPSKIGTVFGMKGNGIYLSTSKDFVMTYYSGLSDEEALLTFEVDPVDVTGDISAPEGEITARRATLVDVEQLDPLNEDQSSIPIKPPSESVHEVTDAQFVLGRVVGNRTIPINKLKGGVVGTGNDDERVRQLIQQISSPDGYIERLIVDTQGNVVEGQHRFDALSALGYKKIPVVVIEDLELKYNLDKLYDHFKGVLHRDQIMTLGKEAIEALEDSDSVEAAISDYSMPGKWNTYYHEAMGILG